MNKFFKNLLEVFHYLFWSIMTTLVSWASYGAFAYLFGGINGLNTEMAVFIANILSWIAAVSFSFFMNKIFVFRIKDWRLKKVLVEVVQFAASRILVSLIEIFGVPLFVYLGWDISLFGIDGMLSKMVFSPIMIIINYFIAKFMIFKKQK